VDILSKFRYAQSWEYFVCGLDNPFGVDMIPKIIHYCWLSGDAIPQDYQRCMDTWKQILADYEFVLWDRKRFDVNSVLRVKQAFETGLYAFAADYIRLYAVYTCGGIYLDMDMEAVKPFDELLPVDIMLAYENDFDEDERIEAGCFGAVKGHPYIRKCMEYYEKTPLFPESRLSEIMKLDRSERHDAVMPLIAPILMKNILKQHFANENYHVHSYDYFTAKSTLTARIEKTQNTFTIHHFTSKYFSRKRRKMFNRDQLIRRTFGVDSSLTKIIIRLLGSLRRVRHNGVFLSIQYYWGRLFQKNPPAPYDQKEKPV
jgi:mannosyltransferase OCH1-like enzyme